MCNFKSLLLALLLVTSVFIDLSSQTEDDEDNEEENEIIAQNSGFEDPNEAKVSLRPDIAPGEQGTPVKIENPTPEQKALIERGYERNAYNEYASDMISVHRSLPDYRYYFSSLIQFQL